MNDAVITHFEPDSEKLGPLKPCIDNFGVGDADAEWPNNILSLQTMVYSSGVIARVGEIVAHKVDAGELALCQRLSLEIGGIMSGVEVGMGSESGDSFHPFFITTNVGTEASGRINGDLIRSMFGNTIFPPAAITVEPLSEAGIWWDEVRYDASELDSIEKQEYFQPWRAMIKWFTEQQAFIYSAFVRIGDSDAFFKLDESLYPPGTELTPCALPRLALDLTARGSLAGLFGVTVQTWWARRALSYF